MSTQANVTKLVSKLKIDVNKRRKLRNVDGPVGRHDKIRKVVTALFKHERIELNFNRGDESRGYAERLISDAIRYGDCHKETMEMANYWILEKQLVHKLFKVLVPRYKDSTVSYTNMLKAPRQYPGTRRDKVVLELRNNIYPSLSERNKNNRNLIHNVLLDEAKKEFRQAKYAQIAENLSSTESGQETSERTATDLEISASTDTEQETSASTSNDPEEKETDSKKVHKNDTPSGTTSI